MSDSAVEAVILAGGEIKGRPERLKATMPFFGRALVQPVIDALSASSNVERSFVVMPEGESGALAGEFLLVPSDAASTFVDNIARGLSACTAGRALLVSCDVPYLTPEAVEDFLARCREIEADVCYPVIRREDIERAAPGSRRTYLRTLDGVLTGGNIALVKPAALLANLSLLEKVYHSRKSVWLLARTLGFGFLVKLAVGRLSIAEIEARCSKLLGAEARAVVTPFAEIGIDMDYETDLRQAEEGPPRTAGATR